MISLEWCSDGRQGNWYLNLLSAVALGLMLLKLRNLADYICHHRHSGEPFMATIETPRIPMQPPSPRVLPEQVVFPVHAIACDALHPRLTVTKCASDQTSTDHLCVVFPSPHLQCRFLSATVEVASLHPEVALANTGSTTGIRKTGKGSPAFALSYRQEQGATAS